ncbi:MAG: Cof-type HAD-IIB family hydrolase [Oscillospiraceae bacterium]|nr:Cof-type HAD-IIB family hydrolase [Oscillospiraceae bacterium]
MKYKLIATDMDGTLVNDDSKLTERTKTAILKAIDKGVLFVAATGRPFSNVQELNKVLHKDMPFIVFNGAEGYMGKSGKLLFEHFLDFDLAKETFDIGQQLGFSQILWTGPVLWANRKDDATSAYEAVCKDLELRIVTDLTDIKDEVRGISKVLWIDDPSIIKEQLFKMNAHFGDKLRCVSSMSHFLEFVSMKAGKGTALAEIGRIFGIDKNEMIAVGDANNDLCMIEYAGLGVAVENAGDGIKAKSDYVTSSNNDDGVAEVIEKFILS